MAALTKTDFSRGLEELDRLSQIDYAESLYAVASSTSDDSDLKLLRLGRLLGVSMKEPFSRSRPRPTRTRDTRSGRAWTLQPALLLNDKSVRTTWQYMTLQSMATESKTRPSVLAERLRRERNFFGHLFVSVHKYVCGDASVRKRVADNVEAAKKNGINLRVQDPEVIVSAGGLALGSYLVSAVPILGFVGAPVIAGLVLLFYTIGVDAFCSWATANEKPAP